MRAMQGYVSLGWSQTPGHMVPMEAVIGGIGDAGTPYMATCVA